MDGYLKKFLKQQLKKKKRNFIKFKRFKEYNKEVKIALINESIKRLKNNYYNPRSKKVENLIKKIENKKF